MTARSQPQDRFVWLFADEAETRLRRIGEHVLVLEGGASADVVAAILRDAHSLKGAAAVVGLNEVSAVAHRLEDALEPYRDGAEPPPAALIDSLLHVVDGLQALLLPIRRGEDTASVTAGLLEHLGSEPAPAAPAPEPPSQAATVAA